MPINSQSVVLFQQDFNSLSDWQSEEQLVESDGWTDISWAMTREKALNIPAGSGFSDYRAAKGLLEAIGAKTFEVQGDVKRGVSGKSLEINEEVHDNWSGGAFAIYLGETGYDEIYLRFYMMYENGFKFRTASDSAIQKFIRVFSCIDDPRDAGTTVNPQDMYKTPSTRVTDWDDPENTVPLNSEGQGGKQGVIIASMQNMTGVMGFDGIFANIEGMPGDLADTKYHFDGLARINWKDYHGTANAGTYSWSYFNPDYIGNGEWVCWEFQFKMNDLGSSNGIVAIWINGTKVAEVTNIPIRKTASTKFNYILLPDNLYNNVYKGITDRIQG